MNEGRLWLYVSPTVGIPLFFVAFVIAALAVHLAILTNTNWFNFQPKTAVVEVVAPAAQ
jgi:light-harvesting protein B-800-850 alpha chain